MSGVGFVKYQPIGHFDQNIFPPDTFPTVEAAGIEPASRSRSEQASTCVSADLIFKPIRLAAARCVSVDPKTSLTFDVFGVIKGGPKKSAGT